MSTDCLEISAEVAFNDAKRFSPLLTLEANERRIISFATSPFVQKAYSTMEKWDFIHWAGTYGLQLSLVSAKRLYFIMHELIPFRKSEYTLLEQTYMVIHKNFF